MQAKNDGDLHGGQRSSEVKYGHIMFHGYHIWSKDVQIKNDDDLHGGQRSSEVKCGKSMLHSLTSSSFIICL